MALMNNGKILSDGDGANAINACVLLRSRHYNRLRNTFPREHANKVNTESQLDACNHNK